MGSSPLASTTSERVTLVPIFYFIKNQSPAPLFLLLRKKSRSARLFACKRPHDGSLSLPTFCEFAGSTLHTKIKNFLYRFFIKTRCDQGAGPFFINVGLEPREGLSVEKCDCDAFLSEERRSPAPKQSERWASRETRAFRPLRFTRF